MTIPASAGILRGLRVLDLTQNVAGPFCTQILADLGAEVIKVERPGSGDDTRQWRPPEIAGQSSTFLALNRNKSSLCLDVNTERGREILCALVARSDVFVHSMKPGSLEKRGLGFETLLQHNPRLIFCELSAFGQSGPLRELPGYDPLMQAFTGIMSVTGNEGESPVRAGVSLIDMGTGMWSALGVLAAVIARAQDGRGLRVSTSLLETGLSWMSIVIANYVASDTLPKKMGSAMAITAPYELFAAADGHVFIAAGNDRLFANVCRALEVEALLTDARFKDNPARVRNRDALHGLLEARTEQLTVDSIIQTLRSAGAPCSELHDVAQVLAHEQVRASGMIADLPIPNATDHRVVGLPVSIDGKRGVPMRPPAQVGADTRSVLQSIGLDERWIGELFAQGVIG